MVNTLIQTEPVMTARPRVALVFVPQGEPAMPHLALPMLKTYLQARIGISADLFDLNLDFYRQLFSRDGITSLTGILEGHGMLAQNPALRSHLAHLAEDISGALALLDGRSWDPARYTWALDRAAGACALFGLAHKNYDLSLKNLTLCGWDSSSKALRSWIEDPGNPFLSFFKPHVEKLASYDLVGISLAWTGQLVPAFLLANLLKHRAPELRIVLGGSLVPHLLDSFLVAEELMRDIDFLVPFEGEQPLAEIVASMRDGQDPGKAGGVFSFESGTGKLRIPLHDSIPLAVDAIQTPDFAGLPIDEYLSPKTCLPVMASRGCYYGRCAFCDHFHHVTACHIRPVSKVLEEIRTLRGRHGVKHFFFVDDSLPVTTLRDLGKTLLEDPARDIRFMAELRPEKELTMSLLEQAAAAGCHALLFGLESGSQNTLDRMDKGIDLQTAQRILAEAHAVGIITWCFFMVGYPGESLDEVSATFRLLRERRGDIDVIAGGPFVMTRHSPLARNGAMPGLSIDRGFPDLCLTLGWHHPNSPAPDALNQVIEEAEGLLGKIYPRLASFLEVHMFAFQQEDYRDRLLCRDTPVE